MCDVSFKSNILRVFQPFILPSCFYAYLCIRILFFQIVKIDMLVFVEGVSGTAGGVKQPREDESINPNRGENMFGATADPLNIPKDRVMLSSATYGPSVFVQQQFLDPLQAGWSFLEGGGW